MTRVLIIGASGQIAQEAIPMYLDETDFDLTLFLRNQSKLPQYDENRVTVIEGDATDPTSRGTGFKWCRCCICKFNW